MCESKSIIQLEEKVTSYNLYSITLSKIKDYYKNHYKFEKKPITLSLEKVNYIDPTAITAIILLGIHLKIFHKEPIKLKLIYKLDIIQYLYHIRFFIIADEFNIFDYDKSFLGGFYKKEYRKEHKIQDFDRYYEEYYSLNDYDRRIFKDGLYDRLVGHDIPECFFKILMDTHIFTKEQIEVIIKIIAELVCNSSLYSKSIPICYVHTNRYKTIISIGDVGIGFAESLKHNKAINYKLASIFKKNKIYEPIINNLNDYITIFEVLNFSMNQPRSNLWTLKNMIVNKNSIIRIHYNATQVMFSGSRCFKCNKSAYDCSLCLLKSYNYNKQISPVRFFNTGLNGVHIEVELRCNDDNI